MNDQEIKEKSAVLWPEVIGAVVTNRNGIVNLCPINYQAVPTVYEKPLSVCLGLDNRSYTLETILQTNEFVYAYPSKSQLKDVLYCGTVSGSKGVKLENTNLEFIPSKSIDTPCLKGAILSYECKLLHYYNVGQFTIVIGEVLALITSDKGSLDKIYSLGGMRYGVISSVDVLQTGR